MSITRTSYTADELDMVARTLNDCITRLDDVDLDQPEEAEDLIARVIGYLEDERLNLDKLAEDVDRAEEMSVDKVDFVCAELDELRERVADFDRGIYTRAELLRVAA